VNQQAERPGRRGGHRSMPHTADLRFEAWGPTREDCIAEAVRGLVESFADVSGAGCHQAIECRLTAGSDADLLAAAIEEVIHGLDTPCRESGTSTEPLSRPPSAGTSRPARHPPGTALRRQDLRDDFPSPAFPGQVVGVAVQPQAFWPFSLSAGPDRLGLGAQPRPRGLAPPLVPQVPSACSPGRSRPRDQSPEMQPVPLPRPCGRCGAWAAYLDCFCALRRCAELVLPGRNGSGMAGRGSCTRRHGLACGRDRDRSDDRDRR